MKRIIHHLWLSAAVFCFITCSCSNQQDLADEYFVGTNFWYGPILGSDGPGSDRARLCAELDTLKALGITNLRVLTGAEGDEGVVSKIEPVLQPEPGKYDESLLDGLGFMLDEMEQRGMKAVLYLNNAWEWSGGFGSYLEWSGHGKCPNPTLDGYTPYCEFVSQFSTDAKAQELYFNHIRTIVNRFKGSDAIYSWQLCNEPRCFSKDPTVRDSFVEMIWKSAALIKSIDKRHMVSTGSEGFWGCEGDMELCERVHSCPDIDYITIHIWPLNWSWISREDVEGGVQTAIDSTDAYIDNHLELAGKLGKNVVIEEFGFPRDGFCFDKESGTSARDAYYSHVFSRVRESASVNGRLKGVNFWGWGGLANQNKENTYWKKGDDYCGDPAQEQQGLNSVYASDTGTISIIKEANSVLREYNNNNNNQ